MSIPKVAVLATALAVGLVVATVDMRPAQASPRAASCLGCHGAVITAGVVTATPITTTPVGGATYTVAIGIVLQAAAGNTGYGIVPVTAGTGETSGGGFSAAATYTATMTAPLAAGTYTYTVWSNQGNPGINRVGSVDYSITVGAVVTTTTTTTPPATTTTTTPPVTTTTPPVTTTTTPPVTTTTTPPVTTTTTPPVITDPGAPTGVTAIPGNGQAVVSWTAPVDDGGSPILGYVVFASPGEIFVETVGTETTATVTGLTNGTAYTFTVIALNEFGFSVDSAASAAVTPTAPTTTTPPVTATVAPGVIPVGAPATGAGGAAQSNDSPLIGFGGLALLLSGAAMITVIRRRRQV